METKCNDIWVEDIDGKELHRWSIDQIAPQLDKVKSYDFRIKGTESYIILSGELVAALVDLYTHDHLR